MLAFFHQGLVKTSSKRIRYWTSSTRTNTQIWISLIIPIWIFSSQPRSVHWNARSPADGNIVIFLRFSDSPVTSTPYSLNFRPSAWTMNERMSALSSIWVEEKEKKTSSRVETTKWRHFIWPRVCGSRLTTLAVGFPPPCPALVSILARSGFCWWGKPPNSCCRVAISLRLCKGTTLSSWSAVSSKVAGYWCSVFLFTLCKGEYLRRLGKSFASSELP